MPSRDYSYREIRASAVVTTSYVNATVLGPTGLGTLYDPVENNQLMLYVDVTLGSLTSVELRVEFSDDGSTYFQEVEETIASGSATANTLEHAMTASENYRFAIPIQDRYIRVAVKGTGTVTNSLVAVSASLGNR